MDKVTGLWGVWFWVTCRIRLIEFVGGGVMKGGGFGGDLLSE